ncbi:hypothetical protein D0839_08795 [Bordetella avium]|nr:hypothetical protein C0J09_10065 [Bordetella avium]AZY54327.1 hypothetical protein C0J07_10290 [Bordetella avium]RIQ12166.1 hypothetical protein D0432_14540 [Bordetella avium]RIQ19399.1 hypothetical protein D0850_02840 [Bordetella avium]RIQ32097.1 hypothetical protein D0849_13140 [Bordetella avium]
MVLSGLTVAHAAAPVFLNQTIINNIPKADRPQFQAAVADVLEQSAEGQTTTWTSTATRRQPAIAVRLTPIQTTYTDTSRRCRLLEAQVSQGAGKEGWTFWFCQQPSGGWRASSN